MRSKFKDLCKIVCLYASVSAAEALENGNIVKGSFFAMKLFELIKPSSEVEKVKIGHFKSNVKNLFLGDIEKINEQRLAVGKSILATYSKRLDFSNNLYTLASSFFLDAPSGIDGGAIALRFFINEEASLFAMFLRDERQAWNPRSAELPVSATLD